MRVQLSGELEHFINEKIASGLYHSSLEVISQGLRLLNEYDQMTLLKLNALRKDLEQGVNELDLGLGTPFDINAIITEAQQKK